MVNEPQFAGEGIEKAKRMSEMIGCKSVPPLCLKKVLHQNRA